MASDILIGVISEEEDRMRAAQVPDYQKHPLIQALWRQSCELMFKVSRGGKCGEGVGGRNGKTLHAGAWDGAGGRAGRRRRSCGMVQAQLWDGAGGAADGAGGVAGSCRQDGGQADDWAGGICYEGACGEGGRGHRSSWPTSCTLH
eukprot:366363-Chlamydomonas_euryale.AAC.11